MSGNRFVLCGLVKDWEGNGVGFVISGYRFVLQRAIRFQKVPNFIVI